MAKKKVTIETLAAMVKRGFDQTATKTELAAVREEISDIRKELSIFRAELERLGADIHDIKITLGLVARAVASQEAEIKNLQHRVIRLEKKVGLAR